MRLVKDGFQTPQSPVKPPWKFFALIAGLFALLTLSLILIHQATATTHCMQSSPTNGTQSVSGTDYISRVVSFTGAGCTDTFDIPARATVEILAVGGGGGGGGG